MAKTKITINSTADVSSSDGIRGRHNELSAFWPDECLRSEDLGCGGETPPKQIRCDRRFRDKDICNTTAAASTLANVFANPCAYDDTRLSSSNRKTKLYQRIVSIKSSSTITSGSNSTSTASSESEEEDYYGSRRSPSVSDNNSLENRPKPPASCDVIVCIGRYTFFYSSVIFKNTSDYLNSRSVVHFRDGRCLVDFPHHSPEEWRPFVGFLQSNLVGAAKLSWSVFPTILPWFLEFEMYEILQDADKFLLGEAVACQLDKRDDNNIIASLLLLLVNVSYSCGLELTKARIRLLLKAKLMEPQGLFQDIDEGDHDTRSDDGTSLDWSLQDLQLLSLVLLKFEDLREYLWESSLIMYLPQDLDVSDSVALLGNSLFPYLLREGMVELVETRKCERAVDEQSKWSSRSVSTARVSVWSETTVPTTNHVQDMDKDDKRQDLFKDYLQATMGNIERFQSLKPKKKKSRDASVDGSKGILGISPLVVEVDIESQPVLWVSHEEDPNSSGYTEFSTTRARRKLECWGSKNIFL
jgi:hypothetical protein